jgi:hypothetical protein
MKGKKNILFAEGGQAIQNSSGEGNAIPEQCRDGETQDHWEKSHPADTGKDSRNRAHSKVS